MKPSEIVRRRLRAQRLWGAPPAPKGAGAAAAVDVVRHLLAVQSQEAAAAKFSIGARAGGVVTADVDAALDAGRLVRTHVLRPTWHTVAAEDLRWLLRLTAPRVRQLSAFMMRKLHVDERLLARTNAALRQALAKNNAMTRDELAALLGIDGPPLTYVLQHAELEAVICSGPERPRGPRGQGKQQTWALVDDRVAAGTAEVDVDGAAAVARLVDRFFRTRGPATVKDCATWCSLTTTAVKQALASLAQLTRVTAGEREYWMDPTGSDEPMDSPRVDLVQGYDEITAGYSDSRDVFYGHLNGVDPHERPPLLHTMLLDGQLIGHWRPGPGTGPNKGKVVVETLLYTVDGGPPFDRRFWRALDDAVGRYGAFVGKDAVLSST